MGVIKLLKKKHLGSGNFEYTYSCTCVPKPVKEIKVTSGNDNHANTMAQQECDEYCDSESGKTSK